MNKRKKHFIDFSFLFTLLKYIASSETENNGSNFILAQEEVEALDKALDNWGQNNFCESPDKDTAP